MTFDPKAWLDDLLKTRGLDRPDGRSLHAYRVKDEEFELLCQGLADWTSIESGSHARLSILKDRYWFPPLFVLFAAEWWRRYYDGSGFSWEPIVLKFGCVPDSWTATQRQQCVEEGLKYWKLVVHQKSGMRFIGEIAFQGGLPLRLLGEARGGVGQVLSLVAGEASRGQYQEEEILGWIKSIKDTYLPKAYQREEIYRLLARVIIELLKLRMSLGETVESDAIRVLDRDSPGWRDRFPLPMDDQAAIQMLEGLVHKVTRSSRGVNGSSRLRVRRILVDGGTQNFRLQSVVDIPASLEVSGLQEMFSIVDHALPQKLVVAMWVGNHEYSISLRRLIGQQKYVPTSKSSLLIVTDAEYDHRSVLAGPEEFGSQIVLPGGESLDPELPWSFVESDLGELELIGVGSVTAKSLEIICALPPGWEFEQKDQDLIGELMGDGVLRRVFRVTSSVKVKMGAEFCSLRLGAHESVASEVIFSGRHFHGVETRRTPVFVEFPDAYTVDDFGNRESAGRLGSRHAGVGSGYEPRPSYGLLDIRCPWSGPLRRKIRAVVLPRTARVEFREATETGGVIAFVNWGLSRAEVCTPGITGAVRHIDAELIISLTLDPEATPPARVAIRLGWPDSLATLEVQVAFPAQGVQAALADGTVLPRGERVGLGQLIGMRLTCLVGEPRKAPGAHLELEGLYGIHRFPLHREPDSPLIAISPALYRQEIAGLLALDDNVDARVTMRVLLAGQDLGGISVTRFDVEFEYNDGRIRLLSNGKSKQQAAASLSVAALCLENPAGQEIDLQAVEGEIDEWHLPEEITNLFGPWLVYPKEGSRPFPRPCLVGRRRSPANDDLLGSTLSIHSQDDRMANLKSYIELLSEDYNRDGWASVENLWHLVHHLPLPTIDLWRAFAKSAFGLATLAMRYWDGMTIEGLDRFTVELAVCWELVPREAWIHAFNRLTKQLSDQQLDKPLREEFLEHRIKDMCTISPSLTWMLSFARAAALQEDIPPLPGAEWFRTRLLDPKEGAIQGLYRRQAIRDGHRIQWLTGLGGFIKEASVEQRYASLLSESTQPFQHSVVNLPIVLAAKAYYSDTAGLLDNRPLLENIQKYKQFDEQWFEDAYDHTIAILEQLERGQK